MNDQIRNGFKEARIAKGLSELEIAVKFKINVSVVRGWESGAILPSLDLLCKLSDFLNVSTDMLLLSEKRAPLIIGDLRDEEKESVRRLYREIR